MHEGTDVVNEPPLLMNHKDTKTPSQLTAATNGSGALRSRPQSLGARPRRSVALQSEHFTRPRRSVASHTGRVTLDTVCRQIVRSVRR